MTFQRFTSIPPLTVKACLAILLCFIPLLIYLQQGISEKTQRQQKIILDMQALIAHRQAAAKIRASQSSFAHHTSLTVKTPDDMLALQLLGKAINDDVMLISVEIDNSQHRVQLDVVSDSLNHLLDFTARLQQLASRVELENHLAETAFKGKWKVRSRLNMEFAHEN